MFTKRGCKNDKEIRTWKTAKNLQQKIFCFYFFVVVFIILLLYLLKGVVQKKHDCQNIQAFLLIPTVCLIRSNVTICFFNHSYIDFFQQTTTLIFQSTKICFSGFRFNKFTVCKIKSETSENQSVVRDINREK